METDYLFKYLDQHTLDPLWIEMAPTDKGSILKEHDNQKHTIKYKVICCYLFKHKYILSLKKLELPSAGQAESGLGNRCSLGKSVYSEGCWQLLAWNWSRCMEICSAAPKPSLWLVTFRLPRSLTVHGRRRLGCKDLKNVLPSSNKTEKCGTNWKEAIWFQSKRCAFWNVLVVGSGNRLYQVSGSNFQQAVISKSKNTHCSLAIGGGVADWFLGLGQQGSNHLKVFELLKFLPNRQWTIFDVWTCSACFTFFSKIYDHFHTLYVYFFRSTSSSASTFIHVSSNTPLKFFDIIKNSHLRKCELPSPSKQSVLEA